jgi:hypothetical protein
VSTKTGQLHSRPRNRFSGSRKSNFRPPPGIFRSPTSISEGRAGILQSCATTSSRRVRILGRRARISAGLAGILLPLPAPSPPPGEAPAREASGPSRSRAALQITASSPLRSSRLSSLSEGPLGCFSPISHCRTVDSVPRVQAGASPTAPPTRRRAICVEVAALSKGGSASHVPLAPGPRCSPWRRSPCAPVEVSWER